MTSANRLRLACRSVKFPLASTPNYARPTTRVAGSLTAGPRCLACSYHSSRFLAEDARSRGTTNRFATPREGSEELSSFKKQRLEDLEMVRSAEEPLLDDPYPRLEDTKYRKPIPEFVSQFEEGLTDQEFNLMGRVRGKRVSGKGLIFLDIVNEFQQVQVMISKKAVVRAGPQYRNRFKLFSNLIQVGDHISVVGERVRTDAGEMTLKATKLPELLSPTMESLPDQITDPKTKAQNRPLDMLVNRNTTDILRLRHEITRFMREHFYSKRFLEFQTPILAQDAGGAVARPFVTKSTEFSDKDLAMRVAPELWLKRLVVGGVDKVFEIGPSFRNEGIDATHNPEFTMCEFYSAYTNLADLITETEELMCGLAKRSSELNDELKTLPRIDPDRFKRPFKQVEFVPELEKALGFRLPKLSSQDALPELLAILKLANVTIPGEVPSTLPKLLDRLAALHLEPLSFEEPVFITHHPACMSPLSKSFICPKTYQLVSARAELFVSGRELANMYEEENDPEAQRRKLVAHRSLVNSPDGQVVQQDQSISEDSSEIETDIDGEASPLDENFIKALDHALPPTGGWGCGVERLVMLFSGSNRISDCLSFGTLRHVVNLSAEDQSAAQSSSGEGKE